MSNKPLFEKFLQEQREEEIAKEKKQQIVIPVNRNGGNKSIDNLSAEALLSIKEFVEKYVRDATTSCGDIFENPNETNNKMKINSFISEGINKYTDK